MEEVRNLGAQDWNARGPADHHDFIDVGDCDFCFLQHTADDAETPVFRQGKEDIRVRRVRKKATLLGCTTTYFFQMESQSCSNLCRVNV